MRTLLFVLISSLISLVSFAHTSEAPKMRHLKFSKEQLHAHLTWMDGPSTSEESKMRIEWHDGKTHVVAEPNLDFRVELFMPEMGHGSAPTEIQKIYDKNGEPVLGTYEVVNMYFVMAGVWELHLTLKSTDGSEETQVWALELSEP